MEIVINKCYGGFSLSAEAIDLYFKKKAEEVYFYNCRMKDGWKELDFYDKVSAKNAKGFFVVTRRDLGKEAHRRYLYEKNLIINERGIPRDDKDLVDVVKELGEKANTTYSKLKIVKILDDVSWEISEDDGMEEIAEKHRVWS